MSPQSVVPRSFSCYTSKFAYQATRLLSLLETVDVVEFDSQVYLVGEGRLRFRLSFPFVSAYLLLSAMCVSCLGFGKTGVPLRTVRIARFIVLSN